MILSGKAIAHPAVHGSQTISTPLFQEPIANWQDWGRVFQSIPAFSPLAREICRREGLPWCPLSPLTPGTNGVFRCGELVLKIFFPKESGLDPEPDFRTETAACSQAAAWGVPTPQPVAQGVLKDKYVFHYLVTAYSPGEEAGDWLADASPAQRERFVEQLKELLSRLNRPASGLLPDRDLGQEAEENPRLQKLPPRLRRDLLTRLETLDLGNPVLVHGDLTGENLLVGENSGLTVIDWADAHLAPAWYELGPLAFELFRGNGRLWQLFAGEHREEFLERLLDCLCLHDFGPDFLVQWAQRLGRVPFASLEGVREQLEVTFDGET